MKKYFLFLLLVALQFTIKAQDKWNKEPYMTKSLTNETVKNIEARTSGGSISVSGANASEARIEVYVSPNGNKYDLSKEEIQQRLTEMYDLNVSVANNNLMPAQNSLAYNSSSTKHFLKCTIMDDCCTLSYSINL